MAGQHPSEGSSTSNAPGESSEVELNIKTLDSQMYPFHVDKNIPVLAFKEKIASEIGVPVGQQRLIFRGKVLKDNRLLSEYHVDNGHTLHLITRQPSQSQSSSGTSTGETPTDTGNRVPDASAGATRIRTGPISHGVVLGSLNLGDQGESVMPDLSRVIGAVLNSIGIVNNPMVNGSGGVQPTMQFNAPAQTPQGNDAAGDQSRGGYQSPPGRAAPSQSMAHVMQIPLGVAIPIPSLNQPIPDSLHTLLEFMNRMELALSQNGNQANQPLNSATDLPPVNLPANALGLPTPEALGVVLRHAQRLLSVHAIEALSRVAGRVEQEGGSADSTIRTQIQTETMQAGIAMQHLGALLLELGRTMLTLRMGQSSAESSVNAGPAVYISPSGPNPIMVQPFPLQTSSLFGGSVAPPSNPGTIPPGGVGPIPRNVNIHIHTAVGQRATNGQGIRQQDSANGNVSGASDQIRVPPGRNSTAAASVPPRPPNSIPLATVVAEVGSQIRRALDNALNGNEGSPAHLESSVDQTQSAISGAGPAGNVVTSNDLRGLPGSSRETSLPLPGQTSEAQTLVEQAENPKPSNKDDNEGGVNTNVASGSSLKQEDNQSSEETVKKSVNGRELAPTNQVTDTSEGASRGVPLGLGLGGLQPKGRSRQSNSQGTSGDNGTPIAPNLNQDARSSGQQVFQSLASLSNRRNVGPPAGREVVESTPMEGLGTGGDQQFDPANVMSQVLQSPALDGLLAGVSQQTGVGSPDVFRNMLGQLTQSPAMMNTVNQIAQQIDGQDLGSMFGGLGSGRSGGGIDLSRMVQQMMPFVSQALGGGSTIGQQAPAVQREVQPTYNETRPSREENPNDQNSEIDLQQVVQRVEHEDSPKEVLRSVVESVVSSHDYGSDAEYLVNELCAEDGLASDFMEMLRHDVTRRVQDETDSAGKS